MEAGVITSQNSVELKVLDGAINFFKYGFILVWIAVGAFFLWPQLPGVLSFEVSNFSLITTSDLGVILEPMRPVSERENVTAVLTYPSSSAEEIPGYYISGSFTTKDLRVVALQSYLRSKGSPMANHADLIVETSDVSGINYKTFVAISGVESGFGKVGYAARVGHNPIGWRGGPGGKFNIFASWNDSISFLIPRLSRGYGADPDPYVIQGVYCPPCEAAGTNEWANGVTRNLSEIEAFYQAL